MTATDLLQPSTVPVGRSGEWAVETFEVSDQEAQMFNIRQWMHGSSDRRIEPGRYRKLVRYGPRGDGVGIATVIMSDTPAELRDHWDFVRRAEGDVLINGLGLGVCVQAALRKPSVRSVTVVEISPDVIRLVEPHIRDPRLTVIQADALTWRPPRGVRYDVVWHDIWPSICEDNLPEMKTLHRRYGRRCRWQGSWCRDEVTRMQW